VPLGWLCPGGKSARTASDEAYQDGLSGFPDISQGGEVLWDVHYIPVLRQFVEWEVDLLDLGMWYHPASLLVLSCPSRARHHPVFSMPDLQRVVHHIFLIHRRGCFSFLIHRLAIFLVATTVLDILQCVIQASNCYL